MKYLLLLLPLTLLAQIAGTFRVTGPVAPSATNSNYGAAVPVYNYGGLLTGLGSLAELQNTNIYPVARRHAGQIAVLTNGVMYQLGSGLSTWTVFSKLDKTNGFATDLIVTNLTVEGSNISNEATITYLDSNTINATNLVVQEASIDIVDVGELNVLVSLTSSEDLIFPIGGKGLVFNDESNKRAGVATLDGASPASVIVSNSSVTTNSLIFLTRYGTNTAYPVSVGSVTNGVNFTIKSPFNGDVDKVFYFLVEVAP